MRNEEAMCEGLLSVVIPVYNIRDYVERCVRSVLAPVSYTHLRAHET